MSRYRIYFLFSLMIVAGLAAALLVSSGYYPIAAVNGNFILARQFTIDYAATLNYYRDFFRSGELLEEAATLSLVELELATLNGLVEKRLVREGARVEAGKDFGNLISNKLEKFEADAEAWKTGKALGLNEEEFENLVLWPQAEREILAGRLFLRGERLEDWLREAKAAASVVIFSSRFRWNGEAAVLEG